MASKGTWFDTKSGKVVDSQPVEGKQLVAPGVEPTSADKARVEAYRKAASGEKSEPQTVTSKSSK